MKTTYHIPTTQYSVYCFSQFVCGSGDSTENLGKTGSGDANDARVSARHKL